MCFCEFAGGDRPLEVLRQTSHLTEAAALQSGRKGSAFMLLHPAQQGLVKETPRGLVAKSVVDNIISQLRVASAQFSPWAGQSHGALNSRLQALLERPGLCRGVAHLSVRSVLYQLMSGHAFSVTYTQPVDPSSYSHCARQSEAVHVQNSTI